MVKYQSLAAWLLVLGIFVLCSEAAQGSEGDAELSEKFRIHSDEESYVLNNAETISRKLKRETPKPYTEQIAKELAIERTRQARQRQVAAIRQAIARDRAATAGARRPEQARSPPPRQR